MARDLLREADQAAGIIRYYLKEVDYRREQHGLVLDPRDLTELYGALARALSIATQLSRKCVQPEEYTAQALHRLVD